MGLFGKMFEKKNCAICGKELGLLGKTKIEDGHLCKECAGKLSPYFTGARHSTLPQIQEQLAYREANKSAVASFKITRTFGTDTKVYIDEDANKVIITRSHNSQWPNSNPDVLDFSQVTGAEYEVDEHRKEIYRTDDEGKSVSYNPPRYEYNYDFFVTVFVNHPYFDRVRFKLNTTTIDRQGSVEFRNYEQMAQDIKDALSGIRDDHRAAMGPKAVVTCPHCGATTTPDASGRCEYCGGAIG